MITTTNEALIKTLADIKWKDGFVCRKCGHNFYKAGTKTEGGRKCRKCDTEESLKRYTVFDNSKIPLEKACNLFEYLVKKCFIDEEERWFKPGSLAYKDEKDQFEQRLTALEFVTRKNERIKIINRKINNLDSYMERWSSEIGKNIESYKEKHPTSESFQNETRFTPIPRMMPTHDETKNGISYKEFLSRANTARHKLQLILEGHENSMDRRLKKYLRTKKPGLALLARKFDLEENTIAAFMKKIHERFKCLDGFRPYVDEISKVSHHDDILQFLHESKYIFKDYLNLFMFPVIGTLVNGEVYLDRKWYKLDYNNGDWQLRQIHFVKKQSSGQLITYYNKPGEEEYICSNPEDYDGSIFIIPIN